LGLVMRKVKNMSLSKIDLFFILSFE